MRNQKNSNPPMPPNYSNQPNGPGPVSLVDDRVLAPLDADGYRAMEEVRAALVIAKQFPRDEKKAWEKIKQALTSRKLAEDALFSVKRGNEKVTGPSIDLAKTLAMCWGNFQYGTRIISTGEKESVVETFAWDLESNSRETLCFNASHGRYSRQNGVTYPPDPATTYEIIASQAARRLRVCIIDLIPEHIVDSAIAQALQTQCTNVDVSATAVLKMLAVYNLYGVKRGHLEQKIKKQLEEINPAQMQELGNIARSIRDGVSEPSDWFEGVDPSYNPPAPPASSAVVKPGEQVDATTGEITAVDTDIQEAAAMPSDEVVKASKDADESQTVDVLVDDLADRVKAAANSKKSPGGT